MAKSVFSPIDEYGFQRPDDFNYLLYEDFMTQYLRVLAKRSKKWDKMKRSGYKRNEKCKRYVRKGVPNYHREQVWMLFSGADSLKRNSVNSYQLLRSTISKTEIIETIRIDIPRTFPDNIFFNQDEVCSRQLFNILATFAHENEEVGYCQGLNYIAGLLLLVTKNEESSYWLLKALVENILPAYYVRTMSGLLTDFAVLDELVQKEDFTIYRHIKALGVPWAITVTKWFVCVYVEVLPIETVLRIWDCIFYEGSKIIFKVALALLKISKQNILKSKDLSDLIECFKQMGKDPNVVNCHTFISLVFKISVSNKTINKLRAKYSGANIKVV